MKYLVYVILLLMSTYSFAVSIELDHANQEIINLNSQVNAFEIQAGKDTDTIKAFKEALLKRSHSIKKVICVDLSHVA